MTFETFDFQSSDSGMASSMIQKYANVKTYAELGIV